MPQMNPMLWLMLFMFFLATTYILLNMIYFLSVKKYSTINPIKMELNFKNWKF